MFAERSLLASAALLVAGVAAAVWGMSSYDEAYERVAHTSDVRVVVGRAIGRVGQQGRLTGSACGELDGDLAQFRQLTADNPEQQVRVPLLAASRDSACTGHSEEPLLAGLADADATERQLLAWRRGRLDSTRRWTIAALVIALAGALAIGAVARYSTRRALVASRASEERYRELARKLEEISITDELTGLYNRRGFNLIAGQALLLARRQDKRVAVVFGDLDGLKAINDGLGHDEGDRAIRELAGVLRASLRGTDVLARLGGDEFVALLYDVNADQVAMIEQRMRDKLADWNAAAHGKLRLAASIGAEQLGPTDTRSLDELVQAADEAMYVRKRASHAARAS